MGPLPKETGPKALRWKELVKVKTEKVKRQVESL